MKISLYEAAQLLLASKVVAIPTETVWGLASRFNDEVGIRQIFEVKKRPLKNPLIVHASSIRQVEELARAPLPPRAAQLMAHFWPGPLTIVLPADTKKIPGSVRAGLDTAAFRIPQNQGTLELIDAVGPIVAPSANRSGKPSATDIVHVEQDFGADFPCYFPTSESQKEHSQLGVESTILIWEANGSAEGKWHVGRLGSLSIQDIEAVLGAPVLLDSLSGIPKDSITDSYTPRCPGQMFRHYAPEAHLTLGKSSLPEESFLHAFDAVIGFSDRQYPGAGRLLTLGRSDNVGEVLHNLYRILRQVDEGNIATAWIDCRIDTADIVREPLWQVFFDRIHKAATKV